MSRSKFINKAAASFLEKLPSTSVESTKLVVRTKFNFSFLDLEQPKNIEVELTKDFFSGLLDKLRHFSAEPLAHWERAPAGRGSGNYLETYNKFPAKSNFFHPPFVPHDAVWARFRLDRSTRLAGFTIPNALNNKMCENERYRYCTNTFYVVFIDLHHGFYLTK